MKNTEEWHKTLELLKVRMHEHYRGKIEPIRNDLRMVCHYVSMKEFDPIVLRQMIEQIKIDHNF